MRSVNLIPKKAIQLEEWQAAFAGDFPDVWLEHSEILAKTEGQAPGALNKLTITEGKEHLFVLDRPTTIEEYEPEQVKLLRDVVGVPSQFFAVDYTDYGLLRRVLTALLRHEGGGRIVVEDEQGNLAVLEDYLSKGESA